MNESLFIDLTSQDPAYCGIR